MKIEKIRKFNLNLKFRVFLFIEKTITFKFYNRIHFVETKKKKSHDNQTNIIFYNIEKTKFILN